MFLTSLPCIHGPSWNVDDQQPALLLATAAIGAATCGDMQSSFAMHRAAQLCLWQYVRNQIIPTVPNVTLSLPSRHGSWAKVLQTCWKPERLTLSLLRSCRFNPDDQPLWVAQSILLVMIFGTYSGDLPVLNEVLAFQSILANVWLLRLSGRPCSNNSNRF